MKINHIICFSLMFLSSYSYAISVKLRPQGQELTKIVRELLAELSTKEVPISLERSSGPTLTLGGVGVSAAKFNPDLSARTVVIDGQRRLEFNKNGPIPLKQAVKYVLQRELGLKSWNSDNASLRFSGADINGDGKIDLSDLAVIMENLGKNTTTGDLNQDRKVNDLDLQIFKLQYAKYLKTLKITTSPPNASSTEVAQPKKPKKELESTGKNTSEETDEKSKESKE